MNGFKSLVILSCLAFIGVVFAPSARAGVWSEATELHFSQPVETPHVTLPAGTYWFVLQGSDSNREVVQIFNSHRTKLYATMIAIPTVQKHAPAETEIVFAERRNSQAEALWKWYYPGLRTGHEFLYPAHEETHLRRDAKLVILTPPLSSSHPNTGG